MKAISKNVVDVTRARDAQVRRHSTEFPSLVE
eukprot:CAMPEP_0204235284 /NCGR_PEP_ID=MMETSP0361-20130328/91573_1 /ASSEMBLY_ACC=CAM_ASM_000343 /TAXON_ID=268821 /ORGANISM="Scrippsiella Hangoei, Strain SHTV-5" /LENGTH=31 /DNA_ID= /DNA_START= /DNA_END= /DNA_ORIENTATION=